MKQWILAGALAVVMAAGAAPAMRSTVLAQQADPVPTGERSLGTVQLGRAVLANGQRLAAGTYEVRLTATSAQPDVVGQAPELNRWVEFVQGGEVRGREVVAIVPGAEIGEIAQTSPPGRGASRVDLLRGGDYLRIWINQDGNHYLIHMPPA